MAVANLVDVLDAQWDVKIEKDTPLHEGQFKPERGYARLVFQAGADI